MLNNIESGRFYFIKNDFFIKYSPYLMQNKKSGNKRPCYFCFKEENNEIYWFIPISTKVKKYKCIYNNKLKKYNNCLNFVFGNVLGKEIISKSKQIIKLANNNINIAFIDIISIKNKLLEKELITQ